MSNFFNMVDEFLMTNCWWIHSTKGHYYRSFGFIIVFYFF